MNSDHYRSMTDAQLAEWHQLATRVDRLTRDLADLRAAKEAVEQEALEATHKYRAEMCQRADIIINLTLKLSDQQSAARRCAGQLVETLRALRTLVLVCRMPDPSGDWGPPPEAFRQSLAQAEEVLQRLDFPF